ncbi:MAG: hypothetical protein ABIR47_08855 [Candidatus Kapaibacterium sp.]
MSHRYEFIAEARDGAIRLPDEISARLRLKGIDRVRVVVVSVGEDESELAARGIGSELIERVAEMQRFDRDVATVVLRGEGAALGTELGERLRMQAGEPAEPAS